MSWQEKLDRALTTVAHTYPYLQVKDEVVRTVLWDLTLQSGLVPGRRDIASRFDIREQDFSQVFRDELSVLWGTFSRNLRLSRAVTLLSLDEDIPMGEIAMLAGYSNPSAMTAAFRHALGVTPRFVRTSGKQTVGHMLAPHDDWIRCWCREAVPSCG